MIIYGQFVLTSSNFIFYKNNNAKIILLFFNSLFLIFSVQYINRDYTKENIYGHILYICV